MAVLRSAGSIPRRESIRGSEDGGKSLNVSLMDRLYGSRGLNSVAFGNFAFFQYSSEGEPHSLYILCSCSTYRNNRIIIYSTIRINKLNIFALNTYNTCRQAKHENQCLHKRLVLVESYFFAGALYLVEDHITHYNINH